MPEADTAETMDDTQRMTRLAEVIEDLTGADFDTAALLAHEVIGQARAVRAVEDGDPAGGYTGRRRAAAPYPTFPYPSSNHLA